MTLAELTRWVTETPDALPEEMRPMAQSIWRFLPGGGQAADGAGTGLSDAGPGRRPPCPPGNASGCSWLGRYATAPPACSTCWTSRPSACTLPTSRDSRGSCDDLVADGNSVILVDHDTQILSQADWLIEMGPEAGAEGRPGDCGRDHCAGGKQIRLPALAPIWRAQRGFPGRRFAAGALFAQGRIHLSTGAIHTVKPLEVDIPKGRLTVVTGVSGSGKTTLILESLVACPGCSHPRGEAAGARPQPGGGGHRPGEAHRRYAHRGERALHRGHLCQRAR